MQRHDMIEAMRGLGLKGMAGAFDDAVTTGIQRQRTTMEILTDLLRVEATHRHAASIRYRMAAARLPVVKDIDAFRFEGTPINEGLVRSLHSGTFVNGTVIFPGTGKVKFPTLRFEVQEPGIGTPPSFGGRPRRRASVGAGGVIRAVERTCSGSRSACRLRR
ncbi:istB-like ATP binding domain protein (plasmid) [Sphingobium sp. RAC03]|nr:istB-like ATP binding domain protein [Sphingobium sp. RAC03]